MALWHAFVGCCRTLAERSSAVMPQPPLPTPWPAEPGRWQFEGRSAKGGWGQERRLLWVSMNGWGSSSRDEQRDASSPAPTPAQQAVSSFAAVLSTAGVEPEVSMPWLTIQFEILEALDAHHPECNPVGTESGLLNWLMATASPQALESVVSWVGDMVAIPVRDLERWRTTIHEVPTDALLPFRDALAALQG
mgnify:CR=1 FL=1